VKFTLNLPQRPFNAIKTGTKKVEGRVPKSINDKYQKMKINDTLVITNENTGEKMKVAITFVHHYPSFRAMFESEGVENVLSGEPKTVEHGIESYNSFFGYKENVVKFGVYAIGVVPITQ
jgi:ASC-1-like (ASCH) protein